MYSQTGAGATQAQYWSDNMGGFKDQKDDAGAAGAERLRLLHGCRRRHRGRQADPVHVEVPVDPGPAVLLDPVADRAEAVRRQQRDGRRRLLRLSRPTPLEHPTGTGPFKFQAYDKANNTVTLVRNDDYWGEKAKSKTLIFKIIPDETARKQELQAGTIDGYDLPEPRRLGRAEVGRLQRRDSARRSTSCTWASPKKNNPALEDLKVRQAIAYALNREQFVTSQLPDGANVAPIFYPDTVEPVHRGRADQYDYDPQKAKDLLAEAGQSNLTLNFWWPTEVSRPYMPDPKSVFTAFKADLEAVGITVNEISKPWNGGYLDGVRGPQGGSVPAWAGPATTTPRTTSSERSSPAVTNEFNTEKAPWGPELSAALKAADAIPDETERNAAYDADQQGPDGEVPAGRSDLVVPAGARAGREPAGHHASPLTDEKFVDAYKS